MLQNHQQVCLKKCTKYTNRLAYMQHIFTHLILEMCIFYNYKNNKRINSKFNKVFALRRHFNVKFGTVFFLTSLAIFGKIKRFFSRLSRFPTKKFEIFTSQTEAHPGFGKGEGTTEGVGAKQEKGVGFHIKKHSV